MFALDVVLTAAAPTLLLFCHNCSAARRAFLAPTWQCNESHEHEHPPIIWRRRQNKQFILRETEELEHLQQVLDCAGTVTEPGIKCKYVPTQPSMEVEMKLLHHEGMEGNVCSIASVTQSSMLQNKSKTLTHTHPNRSAEWRKERTKQQSPNETLLLGSWRFLWRELFNLFHTVLNRIIIMSRRLLMCTTEGPLSTEDEWNE